MGEHSPSGVKRGLGPFSSRQLTLIVCVAIVTIVVVIPTAALAAIGTFTSATATPAVTAFNSSPSPNAVGALGRAGGIGNAARFGVVGAASGGQVCLDLPFKFCARSLERPARTLTLTLERW